MATKKIVPHNTFMLGDNLAVMKTIQPRCVDFYFISPPYPGLRGFNRTVAEWFDFMKPRMEEAARTLTSTGVIAVNVKFKRKTGWYDIEEFDIPKRLMAGIGMNVIDVYPWIKPNPPTVGHMRANDIPAYELIFVGTNAKSTTGFSYTMNKVYKPYAEKTIGKAKPGNKMRSEGVGNSYTGGHSELSEDGAIPTNVLTYSSSGGPQRPRAVGGSFPVPLAEDLIKRFTNPGDLVGDFFGGVGTTGKAAQMNGRRWFCIEIDPDEIEKGKKWLSETQPRLL